MLSTTVMPGQNEPYEQQANGMVSAKNRPILQPKVTAIGLSAVDGLNTFKVGFGYETEQWYSEFPSTTAAALSTR